MTLDLYKRSGLYLTFYGDGDRRERGMALLRLRRLYRAAGFYAFVISRFDVRQLVVGRGDQWISGGALAISTLAAGRITEMWLESSWR